MDIKVKTKEHPEQVTVQYDIPDTLGELTEKFGDETVATYAKRGLVLAVQALVRVNIDKGQEEVQKLVDSWVPGTRIVGARKSPLERATQALSSMSAEDLQALLAKVKAAQKHS